jgi:hypothetical protein
LIVALSISSAPAFGQAPGIASSAKVAGRCFVVHGRLAIWNGNPSVRIWPVGSRRMIGVHDRQGQAEADSLLPTEVRRLILGREDRTVVFGDYAVCPLTRRRPGRMQIVFIERADHLVAAQR